MNKKKPNQKLEERGQIGIGTLAVFIAMVLVAAIATGVLINTAWVIQEETQSTSTDGSQQVTNTLVVTNTSGLSDGSAISEIRLTVKKSPDANTVDISNSALSYTTQHTEIDAQIGTQGISTEVVVGDDTTLNTDRDRVRIIIDLVSAENSATEFTAGEKATIRITTPSGGQTVVMATAPDSIPSSGKPVRL
ncbi:archaellin/type IV pilin N-terminal domain-containing protein [Haloarcula nitratireducens]|uniref:Flagellin n=1 Tax=Haloarcula nitratireducens TaxID=2487749 RepID=A0AAW4PI58_9EURY|nr:archaellin/type IV pilin N-terminal domain-containing protein [Halomicroarcula nitratireducens]MBX0297797.1 hypothetical protein [Halomicroarcula nitratireducens]